MIYKELVFVFKEDLIVEYFKRGIPEEKQLKLIEKQIDLRLTKTLSDLQKEFKILISKQTITSVNTEATYALTRQFMQMVSVFYGNNKLTEKPLDWIEEQSPTTGSSEYWSLKWLTAYPYLILYPTPNEDGQNIIVKSYNDIQIYSYNDGIDSQIVSSADKTNYLNIPTIYDQAILLGMMSQIFDDKLDAYRAEKLRLKALKLSNSTLGFEYNMTGIPDIETGSYNSDADGTPSAIPGQPTYT